MDNKKVKGYAYGVIASVSYGLNPLFALPLYASGIRVDSVLSTVMCLPCCSWP